MDPPKDQKNPLDWPQDENQWQIETRRPKLNSQQVAQMLALHPDWIVFAISPNAENPQETVEVVERMQRAMSASTVQEIVLGNLRLEPRSFSAWIQDRALHLTRMEYDLLMYFIENPDQVIDRKQLLKKFWPDSHVEPRTIDTHVANLRKKLRGFNLPFDSVYGMGYILKTKN
jgi:hypothetical protein